MSEEKEVNVVLTVCQAVTPKTAERMPCYPAESVQAPCFECKAEMWIHRAQVAIVLKSKAMVVGICSDCYAAKKASGDVLAEQHVFALPKPAWTTPN